MERGEVRGAGKRRRRLGCILAVVAVVLLLLILAIVLGVTLSAKGSGVISPEEFKKTFMERCEKFKGYNCQHVWDVFQQAHVNRDPCDVPPNAYDSLITAAPMDTSCNRMMFWSKTKDVVQTFTKQRDCFKIVEKTLLGSVLDGMEWCGKKGSNETVTTGCPAWSACDTNPVRSFWTRVSAAFGDSACGIVTAMLNGSITTPFDPKSIFASIEVKRFKAPKVKNLTVVLVTKENSVSNCTNESLQNLKRELEKDIGYNCLEVPLSRIEECGSDPEKPCGTCW